MSFARVTALGLAVSLGLASTGLEAARPPSESWTVTGRFENDLFSSTDRFYTNGLKLSWVSPDLEWFHDLEWFGRDGPDRTDAGGLLGELPFADDPDRQRHVTVSLGQMMYTPRDLQATRLLPEDRPYAGWLYGGIAFQTKTHRRLDSIEIQAGFTGDWSLAHETQDLVHSLRGFDKARGWDNQIETELAGALIYDRMYRYVPDRDFIDKWGMDVIYNLGGAVGNAFTHVNAGLELRAGWNLPADFGTSLIRPGGETSAPAARSDPRFQDEFQSLSVHVFAAANARLVLHDIFLDGNTFTDSHSVDKEPLVGDFIIGASFAIRRFKITYAHVVRTEEFKQQPDDQRFGSISLSYTY